MPVNLSTLNSKLGSISSNVGGRAGGSGSFSQLDLLKKQQASNSAWMGKLFEETQSYAERIIGGFQMNTTEHGGSNRVEGFYGANIATLSQETVDTLHPKVKPKLVKEVDPDLKPAVDALEGYVDNPSDAKAAMLHEVVTLGAPKAVDYVFETLTGMTLKELEEPLKEFATEGTKPDVVPGIETFDKAINPDTPGGSAGGGAGGFNALSGGSIGQIGSLINQLSSLMASIQQQLKEEVPPLADKLIDDLIINIDPAINDTLRNLIGGQYKSDEDRINILKSLVNRKLDDAATQIMKLTTRTDIKYPDVLRSLKTLELSVPKILNTSTVKNGKSTESSSSNTKKIGNNPQVIDYVDSAEEFEADLQSSTRDILGIVVHSIPVASANDITGKEVAANQELGYNSTLFHYIILKNGRVQRGKPINQAISGYQGTQTGAVHILVLANANADGSEIIGENVSAAQATSFRELIKAFHRAVPGGLSASYSEIVQATGGAATSTTPNSPVSSPSIIRNLGFSPSSVSCGYGGRPGSRYDSGPGLVPSGFGSENLATFTTGRKGLKCTVSKLYLDRFKGLCDEIENSYDYTIHVIGGYNYRFIAGTNTLSWHAVGLAIDINPATNDRPGKGRPVKTDMPLNGTGSAMPQLAAKYGLGWGGLFGGDAGPDAMHFSAGKNEGGSYNGRRQDGIPG